MQNHPTKTLATKTFVCGFTLLLLAAGCQRERIQVYQVAKEQIAMPVASADTDMTTTADSTAPAASALPPGHPDVASAATAPDASAAPLTWKTPDGWTEVPPTEMRVASFKVNQNGKQADISVVPLGGMAGGDGANVNRWCGQVGLTALSPDQLAKIVETVNVDGQPAALFDIAGTNPGSGEQNRIIGVIQHRDDTTWFFKMTGDGALVEQQKAALISFLKSVSFSSSASAQTELPTTLPPGHPDIASAASADASAPAPVSHDGQPNWQVPSDWQEVSGGQFLVAKFLLKGAGDATAAVNVSRSAGDGGGLAANVNRWRGQLGLPPVDQISTSPVEIAGVNTSLLVDLNGTNARTGQPTRLMGIIVSQADHTWFYKLMGDTKIVANQRNAFIKFVQGVNY
jgi:hypothetical protein